MKINKLLAAAAIAVVLPLSACGTAGCDDFAGNDTSTTTILADDCGEDDD